MTVFIKNVFYYRYVTQSLNEYYNIHLFVQVELPPLIYNPIVKKYKQFAKRLNGAIVYLIAFKHWKNKIILNGKIKESILLS